ncbi:MAG TPA: DsbA family protein [Isosphaeraceae bacterium]|jgi:protein-disulfide isomerase
MSELTVPVTERDHIRGSDRAVVTLVEYGDYQCPHCGQAYPVVEELIRQLGPVLRVVYRHFPLTSMHPRAEPAAEAAEAAGAQDKFWEMHTQLFENQDALEDTDLIGYADAIGLDVDEFTDDLASRTHAARIREDMLGGIRSGVNGTPTFFINGVRHDGPYDFGSLFAAIEASAGASAGRP